MSKENDEIHIARTDIHLNYQSYKKEIEENTSSTSADVALAPKTMSCSIDGQVVKFLPGDTIMQAAERAQIAADIPRYCYHPGLPVAGTCRMCTVEVEKMPKLMTSCSTPASEGMVVHTKSEKVLKSRKGVMEFLLANHPLDCPVCDKAGECELQDYNYEYGPGTSRFKEEKRTFEEADSKKLSEKIYLNMNRCVHCERCVRFTDEVTKSHDLVMENRGWKKELSVTDSDKGLWNDYQGCLSDFCPVGALTFTDFRFQKRAWFLDKKSSICDQCSKGCNVEVHSDKEIIYRLMPIFNEKVNGHWMCDEGRVSYKTSMNPTRVIAPLIWHVNQISQKGELLSCSWQMALKISQEVCKKIFSQSTNPTSKLILGTDTTNEDAQWMLNRLKSHPLLKQINELYYYNGINGVNEPKDDLALDHLLRRKDKTPNTNGLQSLGISPIEDNQTLELDLVVYVRFGRAGFPKLLDRAKKIIFIGVFDQQEIVKWGNKIISILPGLTSFEKKGSYTNCEQITQHFDMAIKHLGEGKPLGEIVTELGL